MGLYNTEEFQKKCEVFGVRLTGEQIEKFMDYYELLIEWNSFMNLTAITDFEEVVLKHFVDSLAVCQTEVFCDSSVIYRTERLCDSSVVYQTGRFCESSVVCQTERFCDSPASYQTEYQIERFCDGFKFEEEEPGKDHEMIFLENDRISLIDIGTGAGFPGIPLKIVFPEMKVTLLDSLNKRVKFLNTVIDKLNLKNVEVIHGRAEDFARQQLYREQYDLCVSRAVANLSTLTELCIPFVRVNGYFISYKSEKLKEELSAGEKAIEILGGKVTEQKEYLLPDTDIKRSLLLIRKVKDTPKKYPRKAGTPAKEPIC